MLAQARAGRSSVLVVRGEAGIGKTALLEYVGGAAAGFRISRERGTVLEWEGHQLVPTVHPSSILRGPPESRDEALDALVADLDVVASLRPKR